MQTFLRSSFLYLTWNYHIEFKLIFHPQLGEEFEIAFDRIFRVVVCLAGQSQNSWPRNISQVLNNLSPSLLSSYLRNMTWLAKKSFPYWPCRQQASIFIFSQIIDSIEANIFFHVTLLLIFIFSWLSLWRIGGKSFFYKEFLSRKRGSH